MLIKTIKTLLASFLVLFVSSTIVNAKEINSIVAIVNDTIITEKELQEKVDIIVKQNDNPSSLPSEQIVRTQVLNNIIFQTLQLDFAKSVAFKVSEDEVEAELQRLAKANDKESVDEILELMNPGLNKNKARLEYKNHMIIKRLQNAIISSDIVITDKQVNSFLNSALNKSSNNSKYKTGHILLALSKYPTAEEVSKQQKLAQTIVNKLNKGDDFSSIAMKYSNARSATNGGILSWRTIGELPTLFSSHIANMKKGETYGPIRNNAGLHIIKLIDKQGENKVKGKEYKFSQILITKGIGKLTAKQHLQQIAKEVKNEKDFRKAAKKFSQDLISKPNGGSMGWNKKQDLPQDLYEQIKDVKPGSISSIFKTDMGWHLVFMHEIKEYERHQLSMIEQARQALFKREHNEKLEKWMKKLYDEAYIEVKI